MDRLKVGIFCTHFDEIKRLLKSLPYVEPLEMSSFSKAIILAYDVIFIDEDHVDWQVPVGEHVPIVFLAKNKKQAYNALKYGVLDMLVTPYQQDDFEKTMLRAMGFLKQRHLCEIVKTNIIQTYPYVNGLFFQFKSITKGMCSIDFRKIILFVADSNLTQVFMDDGEKEVGDFSLSHCESLILPLGFVKVHRKYIVNLAFVDKVVDKDGNKSIVLKGLDRKIAIARRRWTDFAKAYGI